MPKNGPFWRVFLKIEACCQTVLPDRSVLIGQKLVENAKIQKFKCDIFSNFQTMWSPSRCISNLYIIISKNWLDGVYETIFPIFWGPKIMLKLGTQKWYQNLIKWPNKNLSASLTSEATEVNLLQSISRWVIRGCMQSFNLLG